MVPLSYYVVRIDIESDHDLEGVAERTVCRVKKGKRLEVLSDTVTRLPVELWGDDNAAERALKRIESEVISKSSGDITPGLRPYYAGLLDATEIIKDELSKFHGE